MAYGLLGFTRRTCRITLGLKVGLSVGTWDAEAAEKAKDWI